MVNQKKKTKPKPPKDRSEEQMEALTETTRLKPNWYLSIQR